MTVDWDVKPQTKQTKEFFVWLYPNADKNTRYLVPLKILACEDKINKIRSVSTDDSDQLGPSPLLVSVFAGHISSKH